MMNNSVEITGLRVVRGRRTVLPGLDLVVPAGQVVGLLGPSGCGKTTLIRSIAGVQRLASGRVTVLGEPAGSPANRTRVGYVTQAASVYPDLTVTQNLAYFAALAGTDRAEAERALEAVDLTGHRSSLDGAPSGEIGRAACRERV